MTNWTNPFLALVILSLCACSSTIDYRGKLPEPEDLAKIQVGTATEEDVMSAIGSPTSTSQFGPQKWFYVYKKTATTSFFKPEIEEESLTIVSFENGKVSNIEQRAPNGEIIDHVKHTTPTVGNDRPILKQVFSNFGRTMKNAESKK